MLYPRPDKPVDQVLAALLSHVDRVRTLNIAGPCESKDPGSYEYVTAVLERLFAR